ncbi:MAG: DUF4397 domain-containing protein [Gemmatimonadaceae bacterium]
MRYTRVFPLLAAASVAVAVSACDEDNDPTRPRLEAQAFVRYVHAVPDTGATDWRPIDRLELAPPGIAVAYRGSTPYQGIAAGARRIRIFPTSENIDVTSQILLDTTITFEATRYYTLVWTGSARSNTDRIIVFQDERPTVSGTQFGVRTINVGPSAVDVYAAAPGAGVAPLIPNLAFGTASDYRLLSTGATTLRVTPTASATVLASAAAPAGSAGDATLNQDQIAGATIGGSLLTAIVTAPTGTATAPTIIYLLDNRPARTP